MTEMTDSDLSSSDLEMETPPEEPETDRWEDTRVQSIREVREAEIESKKFELHREREEIDTSLITKDVQLQKQVRGITEECGKLRLEVGWLERDLSEVKDNARRQILEIRTVLQAKKLKLENTVHESAKALQVLQQKITNQRDQITQAMLLAKSEVSTADDDLSAVIDSLNRQIDEVRRQIYQIDRKYDEETMEAKQTSELLMSEIRNIQARGPELDESMERQRAETDRLQKKLEEAEEISVKMKHKVRKLTNSRKAMREKLSKCNQDDWASRIQSLIGEED